MTPCETLGSVGHLIIAVFTGFGTLLSVWLAHRRKVADQERRRFEEAVAERLQLKGFQVRNREPGDGRGNGR